ncbi:MAG: hypothetical protein AAF960_28780 [Bacteroidota bacterium]
MITNKVLYLFLFLSFLFFFLLNSCKTSLVKPEFTPIVKEEGSSYKALISKSGDLRLKNLTYSEPNNGRMLWRMDVYHQDQNINSQLFSEGWNHLNFSIEQLMLEDEKKQYLYVPAEGDTFIIRKADNKLFRLPYVGTAGNSYVGNVFVGKKLVEVYSHQLKLTNLRTMDTFLYPTQLKGRITAIKLVGKDRIGFEYYDTESSQRKKRNKVVRFKAFQKVAIEK